MSKIAAMAERIVQISSEKKIILATAESCTGGLISAAITEIPGSSAVFDRGFVTYSNEAKAELLGVHPLIIEHKGAVSAETAGQMAMGAHENSNATIAISVTGIAGPGGGTDDKPVGLVWFGLYVKGKSVHTEEQRFGDLTRAQIREQTVLHALNMMEMAISAYLPATEAP